jgi:hypothetical protein
LARRLADTAHNALVRELASWWRQYNASLFDGSMRPPVLSLEETARQLGRWERQTRTLSLSRAMVADEPWGVVLEVLKHEMAHQYCDEVLGVVDEGPHGPTFRSICHSMGIDGRATGRPTAASDPDRARILRRIQRLLALADSPERHEAEAAMGAAQKLMLKHNLAASAAASPQSYGVRWLGRPTQRLQVQHRALAGILADHFFVRCVWVWSFDAVRQARGRVLEICGSDSNLEIASYVHGFLLETAERVWVDHKRAHGITANRDRRRFQAGVMVGFHEKLGQQAVQNRQEGLVWVGDADLEDYVGLRHPSLRRARRSTMRADAAWHHGRSAGREIVLAKPVRDQGTSRGLRLSGPGSVQ